MSTAQSRLECWPDLTMIKRFLNSNIKTRDALILMFLGGASAAIAPRIIRAVNQGVQLTTTTWLMLLLIGCLGSCLFGIIGSLRLSSQMAYQFEALGAKLCDRIDRLQVPVQVVTAGSQKLREVAAKGSDSATRRNINLLSLGIQNLIEDPIAKDTVVVGQCKWCHKTHPLHTELSEGEKLDPRYYDPQYHKEDCIVPLAYKWSSRFYRETKGMAEVSPNV